MAEESAPDDFPKGNSTTAQTAEPEKRRYGPMFASALSKASRGFLSGAKKVGRMMNQITAPPKHYVDEHGNIEYVATDSDQYYTSDEEVNGEFEEQRQQGNQSVVREKTTEEIAAEKRLDLVIQANYGSTFEFLKKTKDEARIDRLRLIVQNKMQIDPEISKLELQTMCEEEKLRKFAAEMRLLQSNRSKFSKSEFTRKQFTIAQSFKSLKILFEEHSSQYLILCKCKANLESELAKIETIHLRKNTAEIIATVQTSKTDVLALNSDFMLVARQVEKTNQVNSEHEKRLNEAFTNMDNMLQTPNTVLVDNNDFEADLENVLDAMAQFSTESDGELWEVKGDSEKSENNVEIHETKQKPISEEKGKERVVSTNEDVQMEQNNLVLDDDDAGETELSETRTKLMETSNDDLYNMF